MKKSFTLIELLVICHNIIVIAHNNGYVMFPCAIFHNVTPFG